MAALLLAVAAANADASQSTLIRHQPPDAVDGDERDDYAVRLLELAMARTEHDHGPANLHAIAVHMSQDRAIRAMRDGRYLDVFWGMTSRSREEALLPVRIPMAQGLLGVRALVAREETLPRLGAVDSIDDLAAFSMGQGHDWPDTAILRHNGLQVATSSTYYSLFRMLDAGRFDLFPRGVIELQAEARLYESFNVRPSRDVVLAYYAPNYFFVRRDNEALAERIETGLRRAMADGSFSALLSSHPSTRYALDLLTLYQPRVLALDNPGLPEATPIDEPALWHRPVFDNLYQPPDQHP
ncbi:substrate-binding periplasmic protein [Aquisalimonas asiatica]|uniref:ABC-type amino acid transport substrate-binding protein n=1 Tax=Aquisalimonas asiatica TaxID=406100 RepID=A0A1H8Q3Y5_9GAMM|nr:transporter substrate-binding domain-containing protein [Aquisalimonas asiatica]SEO48929.1 ABC-type amino acid transport substrate-binding protein [Aquisalimonas asiatica]